MTAPDFADADWNVLAFLQPKIEANPKRLTIGCCCENGSPTLCEGRVPLIEIAGELWPATGCDRGHDLEAVSEAYETMVESLSRGRPGPDADPVGTFIAEFAPRAAAEGIDRRALQRAIRGARHASAT